MWTHSVNEKYPWASETFRLLSLQQSLALLVQHPNTLGSRGSVSEVLHHHPAATEAQTVMY